METNQETDEKKRVGLQGILLLFTLLSLACSGSKVTVTPDTKSEKTNPNQYQQIRLKVQYRDQAQKYSGKITLNRQSEIKKIYFLDPLNQVIFKLLMSGEKTHAVNPRKRRFWQGHFHVFIQRYWNLRLQFEDFYQLIIAGTIPAHLKQRYHVKIERNKSGIPETIQISRKDQWLRLTIRKNRMLDGRLDFLINQKHLSPVDIDQLFEK